MRTLLLATILSLASAAAAHADPKSTPAPLTRCSDGTLARQAGKATCVKRGGVLRPGRIPTAKLAPVPVRDTTVASTGVRCADGTVDRAGGRAACSRHGGRAPLSARLDALTAGPERLGG